MNLKKLISVEECKRIYGLGTDPTCEYEIVDIQKV